MEDVYRHMEVIPLDEAAADAGNVPARLTPQFSLAFLRQAADPALLLTPDGRVSFLNDAACGLFGLATVEAVNGRLVWELWPDADARPVLEAAVDNIRDGDAVRFPAITGDGEDERRWTVILSPVIDSEGSVASIFCLVQPT